MATFSNEHMKETKQRQAFTLEETAELERAWDDGMTSTKCRDHTSRVANSLGITMERVNAWIGNKRGKQKRAGQDDGSKSKQSAMSRCPTAFTLFSEGKKRGNQTAGSYFTSLSRDWAGVSLEDKNSYRVKAKEIRQQPALGQDKEVAISGYLRTLSLTCEKLGKLGVECGGIACGVEANSLPTVFGSLKAHNFLLSQRESFVLSIQETESVPKPEHVKHDHKEEKTMLRGEVRKLFNTCWAQAGGKGKCVPYKEILTGGCSLEVTGLPSPFKEPSDMGISVLREILEHRSAIQFRITPVSATSTFDDLQTATGSGDHETTNVDVLSSDDVLTATGSGDHETTNVDVLSPGKKDDLQAATGSGDHETTNVDVLSPGLDDLQTATGSGDYETTNVDVLSPEYRFKRLLKKRRRKRKVEFLVEWEGEYTPTWEPERNIPAYLRSVKDYIA